MPRTRNVPEAPPKSRLRSPRPPFHRALAELRRRGAGREAIHGESNVSHRAFFSTIAVVIWACFLLVPACGGRSGLDDTAPPDDAGLNDTTTPPACSASTCPNGCCDIIGVCRAGADTNA